MFVGPLHMQLIYRCLIDKAVFRRDFALSIDKESVKDPESCLLPSAKFLQ